MVTLRYKVPRVALCFMCSVVNCISCLVREHNDVAAMPSIPTGLGKKIELEAGDAVDGGTETAPETTVADSTD